MTDNKAGTNEASVEAGAHPHLAEHRGDARAVRMVGGPTALQNSRHLRYGH